MLKKLAFIIGLLFITTTLLAKSETILAANRSDTRANYTIAVLQEDIDQLPSKVATLASGKPIPAMRAATADVEVLLISAHTLNLANRNPELKQRLLQALDNGKTLLVYRASTTEIAKVLELDLPTMTPEESFYGVASVSKLPGGGYATGGVLFANGVTEEALLPYINKDVHEHLASVRPHVTKEATYNAMAAYWSYERIQSNSFNLCPSTGRGKFNEQVIAQRAENDNSTTYDFWNVNFEQQTIGGYSACGTNWRTSKLRTRADVGIYGGLLYRYGPTTTNAETTATVNVGLSGGYKAAGVTLEKSWSYTLPSVSVIDRSDFTRNLAEWDHVYNTSSNAALYSYLSEPGISVRIGNNARLSIYRPFSTWWYKPWTGTFLEQANWTYSFS